MDITKKQDMEKRDEQAEGISRKNMLWAAGVGVVPIPIVDIVGVTAVQVKLLSELSSLYELAFRENMVKSIVASLLAGLGTYNLSVGTLGYLVQSIPVVGPLIGLATMPAVAAGLTFAVGKVFVQHFESGGTFLNFDAKAARDQFKSRFEEGRRVAQNMGKS